MGQTESQPAGLSASVAATGVALHVLRVAERVESPSPHSCLQLPVANLGIFLPKSPAAEAGIDPFFDFICGVNGHQIVRFSVSHLPLRPLADKHEHENRVMI